MLTVHEARQRLTGIRSELEVRQAQAGQRGASGTETARQARERIEAYLGWVIFAQSLVHLR